MKQLLRVAIVGLALAAAPSAVLADASAQRLVEETTQAILADLRANRDRVASDRQYLEDLVNRRIVPHLDFDAMTKLAVYRNWLKANDAQRTALIEEFRTLLLRTYGKSLAEFREQRIEFLPFEPSAKEGLAIVRSRFFPSGGSPVEVDYRLRDNDGWKIYDIRIDGISLVTNYRNSFDAQVAQSGIEGLLQSLRQKNRELAP